MRFNENQNGSKKRYVASMTTLNEIRSAFLDFFEREGHTVVPSGPLVPRNDPTLMFTNAGMVPFKNVFTGQENRDYVRAASSQKCVRAGGKHNDLDNVGYTARHHTFFEMLGNFSFGDYFKEGAIDYAWRLITQDFGISPDRLLVTVFSEDDEAFSLWKKISGFPDDKIIRIPTSDNFWSMGETGPCGPCSEIFYDHGDKIPGGPPGSPDEDGDRFVEIWNLVFMQYDQVTADERRDLPKPSIDTGMGLERIAAVLQGVHDNYDTDLFQAIIKASEEASHVGSDGSHGTSHRVIADHLRSASFLIADGVLPANDGRGYVLRRIMRRAMRHAHLLGAAEPLMWKLVPSLIGGMGTAYPELTRAETLITETLKLEEERFRQTLERGLKLLDETAGDLKTGDRLDGELAFKLYDTYGFPLDLTEDALRARGIGVDTDGFNAAMDRQRAEARAAWAGSGETADESIWFDVRAKHGPTEFLGYTTTDSEGQIVAMSADGALVDALKKGQDGVLVTNQTPFYGESGGQIGDRGVIRGADGAEFIVTDTRKAAGDLHLHVGKVSSGTFKNDDIVFQEIDDDRRTQTRANHSATHLLHAALRNVLGDHVTQKGSFVGPDRLRFDFSHQKAMTPEEIAAVEEQVNQVILQNGAVETRLMPPDDAVKAGALALFGEKYGEEVRVLTMGDDLSDTAKPYSVELCGGTHVARVGDIALFKVISESAVSSGVRRIEAVTGAGARSYFETMAAYGREAAAILKTTPADLPGRVSALLDERKKLERDLAEARKALALGGGAGPTEEVEEIGDIKIIARVVDGAIPKELRGLIDEAKKKLGSGVVALACENDGKAALAVGVTDDLTDSINAVDLVRAGVGLVGGKGGGGRPDMAQAGGPNGDEIEAALNGIKEALRDQLATV